MRKRNGLVLSIAISLISLNKNFWKRNRGKMLSFLYRNKSDVILNGLVGLGKIPSNFLPQLDVTLLFAFRKVDSICFSEPEIRIDIGSKQMIPFLYLHANIVTNPVLCISDLMRHWNQNKQLGLMIKNALGAKAYYHIK